MRRIRIHNDITIRWKVYSGDDPLDVESMTDRKVFLCLPYKMIEATYSVTGNKITITYPGKDQRIPGIYSILLVINKDKPGMITCDCKDVFELVRHSHSEGGEDDGEAEVVSINVRSDVGTDISARLADLLDVDEVTAYNGYILTYVDGRWKAMPAPSSFNTSKMWEELQREDSSLKIDLSHLPAISGGSVSDSGLFTAEYDSDGNLIRIKANAGLYTDSFLSSYGLSSSNSSASGSSSGSFDVNRMWDALGADDGVIGIDHIPTIPVSKLQSSSITISGKIVSLGGSISLDDLYLPISGGTLTGLLTAGEGIYIPKPKTLRIGDAYLSYNSTDKALELYTLQDGVKRPVGFLSHGFVSSFGSSSSQAQSSLTGQDIINLLNAYTGTDKLSDSLLNSTGGLDLSAMWDALGATGEVIGLAHIPQLPTSKITGFPTTWALSKITGADDLKAIEALTGTAGFLKKTAANTWTLDNSTYALKSTVDTIAGYFTDGSAKTAIKLKNARTIWGQSFDGSANVSGAFSGATTGTFSGDVTTGANLKVQDTNSGNVGLELWRGSGGSWKISVESAYLYFRSNWNTQKTDYFDVVKMYHTSGNVEVSKGALSVAGAVTLAGTTAAKRRIYFGDTSHYVELDADGFHFSHGVYSDGFMSSYGLSSGEAGGTMTADDILGLLNNYTGSTKIKSAILNVSGSSFDESSMWEALDATGEVIGLGHIPTIPNAKLSNNKITIAGTSVNLGGSMSKDSLSGILSDTYLALTGGTLSGNLTLPRVNIKSGDETLMYLTSTSGNPYFGDGSKTYLVFDKTNYAVRRGTSTGSSVMTLGTSDYPWASLYATSVYEAGKTLSEKYLALSGGTLTGDTTLTKGKKMLFDTASITASSSTGFMLLNDGTRNVIVLDATNNAVRQASGGTTTLGTSTIPWTSVYATTLYESGSTLAETYLALSGGTLTGDLTMTQGKKIKFGDGYLVHSSSTGNVFYNDGARTMLVFDSVNNGLRQVSGGSTTLGTEAIPWAKVYGKSTDSDHADTASDSDKLGGSSKADLIRNTSSIYTPATKGWYTLATLPADASAARCRYVFTLDCTAAGSGSSRYFACDITLYEDGGSKIIRLEGSNGNGMVSKYRYVTSTRQLQMYVGVATVAAFTLQAHNTLSGVGVRTAPSLSSSTSSSRSSADTTSYQTGDIISLEWNGGYAITNNILASGNVTGKHLVS